jgi:hypothetical protein
MIPPLFGKQEVGIWQVKKHFPRYGVPIWSLWPNIRSLWQESDIWSQASYKYAILWEAFLDPSDSYFLFADLVDFYTHWTYMHIFRHIFLSNYWWQESDIWSQASYRYAILWEAFLDPSHSYFLFADLVGFYTHWTYKQEVGIWWVQKRFPRYGVPIWSLWPNIRSSAINSCWEKCDKKCAYMFNVYRNQLSRQTGSRNVTGPKTLPTIWHTYMKPDFVWLYPRFPKGEGGILFYLCPSVLPSSKIFFVAFFSVTVDDRDLIFGHKLHTRFMRRRKNTAIHWQLIQSDNKLCRSVKFSRFDETKERST